jgi:hypothetical protein
MSFQIEAYKTLGVTQTDSLDFINSVYRNYMRLCHPDKHNTEESINLGLTYSEKITMFNTIQNAYKQILMTKKENNAPDYDIKYEIESDYYQGSSDLESIKQRQQLHYELLNSISNDLSNTTKTKKTETLFFNKAFEDKYSSNKTTDNADDPFSLGYGAQFGADREEEYNKIKKNGYLRPDIYVDYKKEVEDIVYSSESNDNIEFININKIIDTDIDLTNSEKIDYEVEIERGFRETAISVFQEQQFYNRGSGSGSGGSGGSGIIGSELGLSSEIFGNYTVHSAGPNDLGSADLMEVYGANYETFEKTFEKGTGLSKEKLNNTKEKTLEEIMLERNQESKDYKFVTEEGADSEKEKLAQIEKIRSLNKTKQSQKFSIEYYGR